MDLLFIFQVILPEVAALLNKLGLSVSILTKDVTDFFSNVILQTMEVRKTEQDQVNSIKQIDNYKGYNFE